MQILKLAACIELT